MRRYTFQDLAPEGAEVYKSVKFQRSELAGVQYCKAWRGNQSKPYANYRFKSPDHMETWIATEKAHEDEREAYRETLMAGKAQRQAQNLAAFTVGTILHGSWGYDQTNCEFYEIVERRGKFCWVRELAHETIAGSEGFMCSRVRPQTGKYIGQPIKKLIGPYGLSFEHFTLTPCGATAEKYSSWYA